MLIEGERCEDGNGSPVVGSGDDSDGYHEMMKKYLSEKDDDYDMRSAGREI